MPWLYETGVPRLFPNYVFLTQKIHHECFLILSSSAVRNQHFSVKDNNALQWKKSPPTGRNSGNLMLTVLLPVLSLPLNHPSCPTVAPHTFPPSTIQTHFGVSQLKRGCILESWHGTSRKAIVCFKCLAQSYMDNISDATSICLTAVISSCSFSYTEGAPSFPTAPAVPYGISPLAVLFTIPAGNLCAAQQCAEQGRGVLLPRQGF